jgi:hypothetical protein
MFGKMIMSGVLALGAFAGLAMTPSAAEAHPIGHRHHVRFEVQAFHCGRWECRGTYHDRYDANRAARRISRHEGLATRIVRI